MSRKGSSEPTGGSCDRGPGTQWLSDPVPPVLLKAVWEWTAGLGPDHKRLQGGGETGTLSGWGPGA